MSADFPPIASLLPQAGPMRMLERILSHDAGGTSCSVRPGSAAPFCDVSGRLPSWVAIEWMAQCAAVDGGLRRADGEPPSPALFVGSRRMAFRCAGFEPTARLEATARHVAGRPGGLLAFDCSVRGAAGGGALAEGRLHVLTGDFS